MNIRIVRLLVMILLFGNSLNIKINQEKLRNIIGDNDWFSILQNEEKESSYSIVFPQVLKNRVRRFATFEVEDESSSTRVLLSSPAINFNFSLDLVPVTTILSPEFLVFETFQNTSNVLPIDHRDIRNCLYRGRTAALSLCDGQMTGIVHHNEKETYLIRPVPKKFQNEIGNAHFLIRRPFHEMSNQHLGNNEGECIYGRENGDVNCSHITNSMGNKETPFENTSVARDELEKAEHLQPDLKNNVSTHSKACDDDGKECHREVSHHGNLHRKKRKVGQEQGSPIFVETAVFVDKDLYSHMKNYFPNDTERELIRFVLAMVNAVQLLYHDPSLGHAVNFILKRLEILKEEPVNLTRPSDIDRFLSSFCNWQRIKNPGGDREPQHWDHALMLTGLDLYVKSKHGKVSSQVVGLAPVAGMCTPTSSCTVNEGRHFESVYVVAHEIGHNLGMRHDGPLADNDCDPTSYIMSPTLGSGKITWSPCSKRYLQTFLDTTQSKCLLDHGNSAGQLDHEAEGNLPGERFNADQQCRLKYGKDSKHSPQQLLEDICRDLHCDREKYTWTSHPALEGTKCGHNMWCRGGKCISRKLNPLKIAYASSPGALLIEKVDGNWSKWKSKGECDSGCLFGEEGRLRSGSTGIMVSVRKCDNPRPQGGGKPCQGIDRKFQTCIAKQCLNVPRLTINEFANQICARAKEVDKELTGLGFQKNSIDAQESCAVWCSRRDGQVKARGWSFPDGTACNLKLSNSTKGSSYCINGRCEEFLCNSSKEVQFLKHPEQCPKFKEVDKQSQKLHRDESKEVTENWMVASSCHYNCILPGTGIRLVFNKHKRKYYTIQLCEPSRQICTKLRSPLQYASMICGQYKDRVQGLSGYGMQIYPNEGEDPDRPCKVACQDDTILHRFYLVNGKGGWFPFGTECSGKNAKRKAYCVSGKCIEFTQEDVPVAEYTQSLFPRLLRKRRSIEHDLLV